MRVCGIVCEYNPFHNGHKYQIDKIRELGFDAVVAVMSGNFVQRGEPAVLEKHLRAEQALKNGVDLVIELPLAYALSSAQRFAFAAVGILDSLGQVDTLCFGSECADIEKLKKIAYGVFDEDINSFVSQGISYPAAFEAAVGKNLGNEYAQILKGSNNLLGIEYLRALNALKSSIEPMTVKREGVDHGSSDENGIYTSAQNIRDNIFDERINNYMPLSSFEIMQNAIDNGEAPATLLNFERGALALLRTFDEEYFSRLPDVGEGLDVRLYSAIRNSTTLDEVYQTVKTKRYTMARVKRIVLSAILGLDSTFYNYEPPYIRVLGLNETGRTILKNAKETAKKNINMLSSDFRNGDEATEKFYALECKSTDLYYLMTPKIKKCATEFTNNPVIILNKP